MAPEVTELKDEISTALGVNSEQIKVNVTDNGSNFVKSSST